MTLRSFDWVAIHATPAFRDLHRRKARFLWGLMALAISYYFLLPIGAAYFSAWYRIKVWGPINVGLVFALSQFLMAWGIALWYAHAASRFDVIAAEIARQTHAPGTEE
ncbi:MAG: DUF485 domain-containing protein [Gammaproteobacteria bacterium]|nr:DUF485 domain-containing protein [Gammaproteobacteria bacterium]